MKAMCSFFFEARLAVIGCLADCISNARTTSSSCTLQSFAHAVGLDQRWVLGRLRFKYADPAHGLGGAYKMAQTCPDPGLHGALVCKILLSCTGSLNLDVKMRPPGGTCLHFQGV